MTVFQTIAILLTFAAIGSYINVRFLRLPTSIGMMVFALIMSWIAMGIAKLEMADMSATENFIGNIDFSSIFLHGMLSFLLFAGALQIDLNQLKKYRAVVATLATFGVVVATAITGTLVWGAARLLGIDLPYPAALMFGALIAPTDPVAVLGILKESTLAPNLRLKIACESLLNDGVGVVIFLILLGITAQPDTTTPLAWDQIGLLVAWEGVGSVALGLSLGWMAYMLLRGVDDYKTEILITLALAAGGYSFAEAIHVSAPIVMVIAGLVIGNHGRALVMSDKTRKHLDMFWELLDDILNAVLFVLMGLEIMVMPSSSTHLAMGLGAICATLAGRLISVAVPIGLLGFQSKFEKGTIGILTWGGLRGGISIAMALSLPPSEYKNIILSMTYLTVIFSVVFQGTTFKYLAEWITRKHRA